MPDVLAERGVLMVHARYRVAGGEDVSVAAEGALLRTAGVPVRLVEVGPVETAGPGAVLDALWNRAVAARLRTEIADHRPALVHVQNLWPAASPAVIGVARSLGLPVVATLRNARFVCPAATLWRQGAECDACRTTPWPGILRGCWRGSRAATLVSAAAHRWHPAWRGVARFIAPSAFLRDAVAAVIDPRRVSVVANRLGPLPPPAGERQGVLYAGRLAPEKGVDVLVEAARRAGLPLTVLGGDRTVSPLDALAAMSAAQVVAVPSLWPEPFGRAALEGMACGAAVVASRVGGLPEVVGEAGLLVPPGDVEALEAALRTAAADHQRLGPLGQARADALAGDGAAPLLAVYRSVLTAPVSHHHSASPANTGSVRK